MAKLYYVRAEDNSGENADAYVWADSPAIAAKECCAYWRKLAGTNGTNIMWVDEVPSHSKDQGVVGWETIVRHEKSNGKWQSAN